MLYKSTVSPVVMRRSDASLFVTVEADPDGEYTWRNAKALFVAMARMALHYGADLGVNTSDPNATVPLLKMNAHGRPYLVLVSERYAPQPVKRVNQRTYHEDNDLAAKLLTPKAVSLEEERKALVLAELDAKVEALQAKRQAIQQAMAEEQEERLDEARRQREQPVLMAERRSPGSLADMLSQIVAA